MYSYLDAEIKRQRSDIALLRKRLDIISKALGETGDFRQFAQLVRRLNTALDDEDEGLTDPEDPDFPLPDGLRF